MNHKRKWTKEDREKQSKFMQKRWADSKKNKGKTKPFKYCPHCGERL